METFLASVSYSKVFLFLGIFVIICILVIAAIMLDLWDGVYTARATGVAVHSHKLRVTVRKMSEYWRFIIVGFLIDCIGCIFDFYLIPYVAVIFGTGLILIEIKSMFEHARQRKSQAADLRGMIRRIVDASNEKEALDILRKIVGSEERVESREERVVSS